MTDKSARQLQKKIRELERANRDLDSTNRDLASSNQILTDKNIQLEENISEERNLWKSRHGLNMPVNADRASLLHRIETLDDIINDKTRLYAATLRSKKEFEYILRNLEKAIKESKDAPLFRNNEKRSDDPGNRCSLYPRHALLMCLLRLKDNPTQGTLEAFFGIDQSTVSRYLQFCNRTLRHDISRRFGLWALEGQRVFGTYHGNHISRFINGAVSLSGKRFFTATNTLATPVVIDFFTDLLKWRGKIAAILDRASWNKSGKMKQFLADNEERIDYRYFPVGWPQLNPMEGFWNILKRNSLMHEHYDNVDERVGRAPILFAKLVHQH